jgi:hypothetical protein
MAKSNSEPDAVEPSANSESTAAASTNGSTGQARRTNLLKKAKKRKTKTVKTAAPQKVSPGNSSAVRAPRPFPALPLQDALKVPQAIREKNNGNDWDTDQVATALEMGRKGPKFFYHASASRDYGLTTGSRDTDKIGLTQVGRAIFFAGDELTKRKKTIEAFFSVDLFKRVYQHYGSGQLPEDQYLNNVLLSEFNLAVEFHAEFRKVFEANCKFLKIEKGSGEEVPTAETSRPEHGADIRVLGEAKGKFDRTAFVIMPFVEKGQPLRSNGFFKEVLTKLITPACNQAGFAVETAEQDGSDVIQSTIINQLLKAQLVVADLSDHNPNVLFELGIRIAKEMPVALIKAEGTGRVFDVDNMMRVLNYNPNLWSSTVETDLPKISKHIKAAWDNRTTARTYMQILTGSAPTSMLEMKDSPGKSV